MINTITLKNLLVFAFSASSVILFSGRQTSKMTFFPNAGTSGDVLLDAMPSDTGRTVSGMIQPKGQPISPPFRFSVGDQCVVDLIQEYTVTGSFSGSMNINYRILVLGQCGGPPGSYEEEWIAYGTFHGKTNGTTASCNISYLAKVKKGGDVTGIMTLGQGINGHLEIKGNFKDEKLSYSGQIGKEER